MVFLKVVLVGLASPRGLTVQCFPQEYFSPTPPFHFRCAGPYLNCKRGEGRTVWWRSPLCCRVLLSVRMRPAGVRLVRTPTGCSRSGRTYRSGHVSRAVRCLLTCGRSLDARKLSFHCCGGWRPGLLAKLYDATVCSSIGPPETNLDDSLLDGRLLGMLPGPG